MIVIGAKGHAIEILQVIEHSKITSEIMFYDGISASHPALLYGKYPIITQDNQILECFKTDNHFILGIGGPALRRQLFYKFLELGGTAYSIICETSIIGKHDSEIMEGCNIMSNVIISNSVRIGKGVLLNRGVSIHHDVVVDDFCEIAPGAQILGRVRIGENSFIGANSTILPNITVGKNVIIGAGTVVTKHIPDNVTAVGIPAKIIKEFTI